MIRVKYKGGKILNNCLFPTQGSCVNLGLWKSTNSDGNTNTDKKQKTIFQKAPWKRGAGRFFYDNCLSMKMT